MASHIATPRPHRGMAPVLCIVLLSLLFCTTTFSQISVQFDPHTVASAVNRIHFRSPTGFDRNKFYQLGTSSGKCDLFAPRTAVDLDPIGECFTPSHGNSVVGTFSIYNRADAKDTCHSMNPQDPMGATLLAQFTVNSPLPPEDVVSCYVKYLPTTNVGTPKEPIVYRSVDAPEDSQTLPIELKDDYPTVPHPAPDILIMRRDNNFAANNVLLRITNLPPGSHKLGYNTTQYKGLAQSEMDVYCYAQQSPKDLVNTPPVARWYIHHDGEIYLHRNATATTQNNMIFCPFALDPILTEENGDDINTFIDENTVITFSNQDGQLLVTSPHFQHYRGETLQTFTVETPDEESTDVFFTMYMYLPQNTSAGTTFTIQYVSVDEPASKIDGIMDNYATGFEEITFPKDFLSFELVQKRRFVFTYTASTPLTTSRVVPLVFKLKNNYIQAQGDVKYRVLTNFGTPGAHNANSSQRILYDNVIFSVFYNTPRVVYYRALLRNHITQYDLTASGWSLNATTVVTAQVMDMDFVQRRGWLTIMYLTDSYDDGRRTVSCRYLMPATTTWKTAQTDMDFGTFHVFIKERLSVDTSVIINCLLPLKSQNLVGYKPLPHVRQLRLATWSYDKTTRDGAHIYEGNNGHGIQVLDPRAQKTKDVVVLQFRVPTYVISTEHLLTKHFDTVLSHLSRTKSPEDGKPLFPLGLQDENVYSIHNYKFRNLTVTGRYDPYHVAPGGFSTTDGVLGHVAFGIIHDDIESLQKNMLVLNNALSTTGTTVYNITADQAYISSLGMSTCGAATARKCLPGGFCTSHTHCGAYSECHGKDRKGEDAAGVCWDGGLTYNPFNAGVASSWSVVVVMCVVAVVMSFV